MTATRTCAAPALTEENARLRGRPAEPAGLAPASRGGNSR